MSAGKIEDRERAVSTMPNTGPKTGESHPEIRDAVRKLCARFPGSLLERVGSRAGVSTEFVHALTEAGFLSVLILEEYGGSGLRLGAATAILEEIHRSGGNGAACHAQMYTMGTVLRHGTPEQKQAYLPGIDQLIQLRCRNGPMSESSRHIGDPQEHY